MNRCQGVVAVCVRLLPFPHFSETNLKAILSMALVLGVCTLACAADRVDPVGTWKCEYKIGDQQRTLELTIKKEGDKLGGSMTFQDKQEAKLKDPKFKDGELTFSVDRELMDNKFTVEYKLKVDGDKIKGKAMADVGGDKIEIDVEAKREK